MQLLGKGGTCDFKFSTVASYEGGGPRGCFNTCSHDGCEFENNTVLSNGHDTITIMRKKSETSSYEGGGEVGYSVLGILSTAGGAECTLRIPKRQKKHILRSTHLPNVASLPSLVCLAFCPVLLWLVCRSKVHARGVIVVSGKHTVTPCGNLAPSGDEWR